MPFKKLALQFICMICKNVKWLLKIMLFSWVLLKPAGSQGAQGSQRTQGTQGAQGSQ